MPRPRVDAAFATLDAAEVLLVVGGSLAVLGDGQRPGRKVRPSDRPEKHLAHHGPPAQRDAKDPAHVRGLGHREGLARVSLVRDAPMKRHAVERHRLARHPPQVGASPATRRRTALTVPQHAAGGGRRALLRRADAERRRDLEGRELRVRGDAGLRIRDRRELAARAAARQHQVRGERDRDACRGASARTEEAP